MSNRVEIRKKKEEERENTPTVRRDRPTKATKRRAETTVETPSAGVEDTISLAVSSAGTASWRSGVVATRILAILVVEGEIEGKSRDFLEGIRQRDMDGIGRVVFVLREKKEGEDEDANANV